MCNDSDCPLGRTFKPWLPYADSPKVGQARAPQQCAATCTRCPRNMPLCEQVLGGNRIMAYPVRNAPSVPQVAQAFDARLPRSAAQAQNSTTLEQHWPKFGQCWPGIGQTPQSAHHLTRNRLNFAKFGPISTNFGSNLAHFDHESLGIDQHWSKLGDMWQNFGQIWATRRGGTIVILERLLSSAVYSLARGVQTLIHSDDRWRLCARTVRTTKSSPDESEARYTLPRSLQAVLNAHYCFAAGGEIESGLGCGLASSLLGVSDGPGHLVESCVALAYMVGPPQFVMRGHLASRCSRRAPEPPRSSSARKWWRPSVRSARRTTKARGALAVLRELQQQRQQRQQRARPSMTATIWLPRRLLARLIVTLRVWISACLCVSGPICPRPPEAVSLAMPCTLLAACLR